MNHIPATGKSWAYLSRQTPAHWRTLAYILAKCFGPSAPFAYSALITERSVFLYDLWKRPCPNEMACCHFKAILVEGPGWSYPILCGKNSRGCGFVCGGGVGGMSWWGFSRQGLAAFWCGLPSAFLWPLSDGVRWRRGSWDFGDTGGLSAFGCMLSANRKHLIVKRRIPEVKVSFLDFSKDTCLSYGTLMTKM